MKKACSLILLVLNFLVGFSQQKSIEYKINDFKLEKILVFEEEILYYNFTNAMLDDDYKPYYSQLIPLEGHNYEAGLTIRKTENISFNESVTSKSDFPNEIVLQQEIVIIQKKRFLQLVLYPYAVNGNSLTLATEFSIELSPSAKKYTSSYKARSYAKSSVLSSGYWAKIKFTESGVCKITYNQLLDYGITNPENVRVYGYAQGLLPSIAGDDKYDDLVENPIFMYKGADGVFNKGDYILFYAQKRDKWYYDSNNQIFRCDMHRFDKNVYYYLTSSKGAGKKIGLQSQVSATATHNVTTYDYYEHHEEEEVSLFKSGNRWFADDFESTNTQTYNFTVPDVAGQAKVATSVAARSSSSSSFSVFSGEQNVGTLYLGAVIISSHTGSYAMESSFVKTCTPQATGLSLRYVYNSNTASAQAFLDYITVNIRRNLKLMNNQMLFRDAESFGAGNVANFTIQSVDANTKVWDVTDIENVKEMPLTYTGSSLSFKATADSIHEYLVFNGKSFVAHDYVGQVKNQNLHGLGNIDMVIVYYPDLEEQALELAEFRRQNDNLSVVTVTEEEIFNEFSSGRRDVSATRDFMKMLYDKAASAAEAPKYLLLFGDGSYCNHEHPDIEISKILTYQSFQSIIQGESFVSDDYYGCLDDYEGDITKGNNLLDIGIGRLPANDVDEAEEMVEKIKRYSGAESMGDWRNDICFIADDEDGNIHMSQADSLARFINTNYPFFNTDKIYLDAFLQVSGPSGQSYPDVTKAINDKMAKGALIINYTGHGGSEGMSHERIVELNDIKSWTNVNSLPLFVTATCEFSRYDIPDRVSPGEFVILNPEGGGIGLLSTTRLVYSGPNHVLNVNFYKFAFEKDTLTNMPYRIGDIFRLSKANTGGGSSNINKRNFSFLGDPAIKLCYPSLNVVSDSINGIAVANFTDTIGALSKVTIHGHIENESGNLMSGFNGTVYPRILDKQKSISTLSNDGYPQFKFGLQNNVLYKGKASVINGYFSFSFIVPKDISYTIDYGKISYYGNSGLTDAAGYNFKMLVGGTAKDAYDDKDGPELMLYMNDESFAFGGMTDENPFIYAQVSDTSGINTVGNGIGHDIAAVLDNATSSPYILNDYYEAELDNYQKGSIKYQLKDLTPGEHKLKLKVWDVYNNSTEEEIEFIVESSEELALKHVLNYPNPFTTHTSFFFEHNRPGQDMSVLIQIFTVSGKLVKTIESEFVPDGYRCGPFDWNGLDDYGDKIGKGVYVYRVKVRSDDEIAEEYQKLVILN